MAALQSTDYTALNAFATNGDRVGYWSYLANKGDPYANLALGVATNETVAGYIANNFFLSQARSAGLSLSETQLYQIGVDLMKADLAARELRLTQGAPDGGLKLEPQEIYNYHDDIFKRDTNNQLDGRAWTAELALRDALSHGAQTGDYSQAESIWSNMQSSSFWTQASSMDSVPSGLEGAAWKLSVAGSVASFQSTALIGNPMAEFSLRNTGQIEGWSQSGDGQWYRYLPGSNLDIMGNSTGFSPEKIYADSATSDHLNQVQQVRQQLYGGNAIHVADGSNGYVGATEGSFTYDSRGYLAEADAPRSDGGTVKSIFDTGTESWSSQTSAFDVYQRLQAQRVVSDGGVQQLKQFDNANNRIWDERDIATDPNGNVTNVQVRLNGENETRSSDNAVDFSAIGQVFGSAIGRAIVGKNADPFVTLTAGTVAGFVGQKFVQALINGPDALDLSHVDIGDIFNGQGVSLAGAGLGAASSFLTAELATSIGLTGVGAQMFNAAVGGYVGSVLNQVRQQGFNVLTATIEWDAALHASEVNISSAFGSLLAHQFRPAESQYGAVGGQLAGAIGSALAYSFSLSLSSVLNVVFPGIGAFFGTIIGTIIGDVIAGDPAYPKAAHNIEILGSDDHFTNRLIGTDDHGNAAVSQEMGDQVVKIANSFLDAIHGAGIAYAGKVDIGYNTGAAPYPYVTGWFPTGEIGGRREEGVWGFCQSIRLQRSSSMPRIATRRGAARPRWP